MGACIPTLHIHMCVSEYVNHMGACIPTLHIHMCVSEYVNQVLVDAVNFGVIPIVYEYEGTTLESLMSRLDLCLQGRNAQYVNIHVDNTRPIK